MTPKNQHRQDDGMDGELRQLFEKAREADAQSTINVNESDTKTAYRQVSEQAELKPKRENPRWRWYYAAAAIFLVAVIGISYLAMPRHLRASNGQTRIVSLNDGTTVTLNGNSTLTYYGWFGFRGRTVSLTGEAFFDVTHTGTPFRVKAGRARITVMGTKFDVRYRPTGKTNKTTIFLKEGQVKLSSVDHKKQAVILKPGEFSWVSDSQPVPVQPAKTNLQKATAWMQQGLSFNDQPISIIFETISSRFDVKIQTKPKSLAKEKLTIYLSNLKNAEQAIADICTAKGWKYTQKGDKFVIMRSIP